MGGNAERVLCDGFQSPWLISALLFVFIREQKQKEPFFDREKRIIVLDPGHGDMIMDQGVRAE
jgi:N-acetylmuramoyl-L-alanine amidase